MKTPVTHHQALTAIPQNDRLKRHMLLPCGTGGQPVMAENIRQEQDARRLAATWNACIGIPTEMLERNAYAGGGIVEAKEDAALAGHLGLQAQVDELKQRLDIANKNLQSSQEMASTLASALNTVHDECTRELARGGQICVDLTAVDKALEDYCPF